MTLRPAGCNKNLPGVRLQLEDYIYPSESIVYRLHPQWRVKAKRVPVTVGLIVIEIIFNYDIK